MNFIKQMAKKLTEKDLITKLEMVEGGIIVTTTGGTFDSRIEIEDTKEEIDYQKIQYFKRYFKQIITNNYHIYYKDTLVAYAESYTKMKYKLLAITMNHTIDENWTKKKWIDGFGYRNLL